MGLMFSAFVVLWMPEVVGGTDGGEGTLLWNYEAGDRYRQISISDDGNYIAVGSYDNKVYLFEKNNATPLWSYTTPSDVKCVAISGDGKYIAAGTEEDDRRAYLFERESSTPIWSYQTDEGGNHGILGISLSANGEIIAVGASNGNLCLFNKSSSTPLWRYDTGSKIFQTSISADGEYITAGNFGDTFYLWDKDNSTPVWIYQSNDDAWDIEISTDGNYIAAGSKDGSVYFFERDNSTPLWSYDTGASIHSIDISGDGAYVVAGSYDNNVYLFDSTDPSPIWNFTAGDWIMQVEISADGSYITATSWDDHVYFFNKESHNPKWKYNASENLYAVAISANGESVATGSEVSGEFYLFSQTDLLLIPSLQVYYPGETVSMEIFTRMGETITRAGVPATNSSSISILIGDPNGNTSSVEPTRVIAAVGSNPSNMLVGSLEFLLPADSPEGTFTVDLMIVSEDEVETDHLVGTFVVEKSQPVPADEADAPFVTAPYVAGTLVFSGLVACVWLSERWRYLLFAMIVLPMYTRLKNDIEKDLMQQNNRGRIYQHIKDYPGVTLNLIKNAVETGNGTTVYHLKILEKDGRIVRTGNHYFIRGAKPLTYNGMKRPFTQRENAVIHYLLTHGKSEERTIHTDLRETQSSVNRDLKFLAKSDVVARAKIGMAYRYFLTQNYFNWHSGHYSQPTARIRHTCPGCGSLMPMRDTGVCLNCGRKLT